MFPFFNSKKRRYGIRSLSTTDKQASLHTLRTIQLHFQTQHTIQFIYPCHSLESFHFFAYFCLGNPLLFRTRFFRHCHRRVEREGYTNGGQDQCGIAPAATVVPSNFELGERAVSLVPSPLTGLYRPRPTSFPLSLAGKSLQQLFGKGSMQV